MAKRNQRPVFDVMVIGAGPAGLGMAWVLRELGIERYAVLERGDIGESFRRWPREMRFITPSFPAHGFGQLDLNAVVPRSSPGLSLKTEHMCGRDYAAYLAGMADYFDLPILPKTEVHEIHKSRQGFCAHTSRGEIKAKFVVWAGGEFQYPRIPNFPGSALCVHNSHVKSWSDIKCSNPVVIGGYESGIDAAVHLARTARSVRVIDPNAAWASDDHDPSRSLSPFTHDRLRVMRKDDRIDLIQDEVESVERAGDEYLCVTEKARRFVTDSPPILATGFETSLSVVREHFLFNEHGHAVLTTKDESLRTPDLFLAGPMIRHEKQVFCFIYKFRQRLAIIGCEIGRRLGLESVIQVEKTCRAAGMYLDDLSCCVNECQC